jgi:hypothetical protein
MISFIIIDKTGNLNESTVDKLENVYKKCGLRKSEDFTKVMVYNLNSETAIELWGRVVGRNNTKNPFVFKLDTSIKLFGPAAIICIKKNKLESLFISEYNNIQLNEATPAPGQAAAAALTPVVAATHDAATPIPQTQSLASNVTKIEEVLNDTDLSENSLSDSELETEDYIYSSEEENNKE